MDENNPLGLDFTTPINPLEALSGFGQNVQRTLSSSLQVINGVARQVPTFLTEVRESFTPEQQPEQTKFDQKVAISPTNVGRIENQLSDTIASSIESTGDLLGVPRSISTPVAGVVGAIATPGVGDLKLAFGAGGVALTGAVTLKNPKILKPLGLETGDEIVDTAQAKFNTKRLQKIEQSASKELTAKETIQNLKDTYGKKPSKAENELVYRMFSRAEGALGRAKEDLSRAQSNVFADKDVYFRSTPSKKAKAVEIINRRTYRKIPNNVSIQIDEHHGFPKGMSAALFDRMDQFIAKGIADPDDLLVMARHAERKGALAGDYKSNMINLVKKPHDELHNYLKNSGDELSKKQWIDVARKAKTPDDLLIIFDDLLDRNVIPNLETAKIWQPLSDLIEDIQKAP